MITINRTGPSEVAIDTSPDGKVVVVELSGQPMTVVWGEGLDARAELRGYEAIELKSGPNGHERCP